MAIPMSPKTPPPITAVLLILGGAVFVVLGGLHAIYTLLDLRNPRRLVPVDPSVGEEAFPQILFELC